MDSAERADYRISIHAPRTGSDRVYNAIAISKAYFNPRSPHGERHCQPVNSANYPSISIHAPRTGSDIDIFNITRHTQISIHAPRTGSDDCVYLCAFLFLISIHAPRTGSDGFGLVQWTGADISIHAPRTGSDVNGFNTEARSLYFNPRSPHGERRCSCYLLGIS